MLILESNVYEMSCGREHSLWSSIFLVVEVHYGTRYKFLKELLYPQYNETSTTHRTNPELFAMYIVNIIASFGSKVHLSCYKMFFRLVFKDKVP